MKKILWLPASVLCFVATCASASTDVYKSGVMATDNGWFIGAGGGLSWNHFANSTATISNGSGATPPMDHDTFSISDPSSNGVEQLSVGYRWHQEKKFIPYYQVYFQYRNAHTTNINGTVDQYSLPEFVNYNYTVNYGSELYTINGKIDLAEFHHFMPYVALGIGMITTHLSSYNETAIPPVTPRWSPAYHDGSQTSLAITTGVGVDFIVTKNIWLTLGYDHLFEGQAQSGDGSGSWSGTNLNLGSVHADTVFLNISAKIPDTFEYANS